MMTSIENWEAHFLNPAIENYISTFTDSSDDELLVHATHALLLELDKVDRELDSLSCTTCIQRQRLIERKKLVSNRFWTCKAIINFDVPEPNQDYLDEDDFDDDLSNDSLDSEDDEVTLNPESSNCSFPVFFAFLLFLVGFGFGLFAPSLITIPTYADVINFAQPVLSPLLDTLSLLVSKLPW